MKRQFVAFVAVCAILLHESQGQSFPDRVRDYVGGFAGGTKDMYRAYSDMRRANTIGADKYFHARGNYEAAQRGTGGRHAAAIISNTREAIQTVMGRGAEDSRADQEANRWGRNGGDPNVYRPKGLDPKY